MVNAQEWINQNYPKDGKSKDPSNEGKKRAEITELDISIEALHKKGMLVEGEYLEGDLDDASLLGFDNLHKLNISANHIIHGIVGEASMMEEIDYSYNYRPKGGGSWGGDGKATEAFPKLQKLSLSHTNIKGAYLLEAPELTHLDISNNILERLDLTNNKKLVELKCSNNNPPTFALSPAPTDFRLHFPNLVSVDCMGIKFPVVDATKTATPTQTDSITANMPPPSTIIISSPAPINNSNNLIVIVTVPLGVLLLVIIIIALAFCYRKRIFPKKDTRDTRDHHMSEVIDNQENMSPMLQIPSQQQRQDANKQQHEEANIESRKP